MVPQKSYRVAEYKIKEYEDGSLWWESHYGFGSVKQGKCFKKGNILFLEPGNVDERGFLKLEFLEHLNRLPIWGKTDYYCHGYHISKCSAFRKLAPKKTRTIRSNPDEPCEIEPCDKKPLKIDETDTAFRIGFYRILLKPDGKMEWQLRTGRNNLKAGECFIVEDILFIGTDEMKTSTPAKKELVRDLLKLPYWEKTEYFCRRYAIYDCKFGRICNNPESKNSFVIRNKQENRGVFNSSCLTVIEKEPFFGKEFINGQKEKAREMYGQIKKQLLNRLADFKKPRTCDDLLITIRLWLNRDKA